MGFSVEADLGRNLIRVNYTGHVRPEEARLYFEKLQTLLENFKPGFRLLNDFTRMESMDPACSMHMEKIMDLCDKNGVAVVVRVIPDPSKDIGFSIMSRFHYARDVIMVTCENHDEAARALAG